MSVINVVTWDRSGLFYKLAGALTLSGLAITSTRAISRKDHISIDTFYVVDFEGKMATQSNAKERLKEKIEAVLVQGDDQSEDIDRLEKTTSKKVNKETLLPSPFPPSVEVYHELSLQKTIIEVKAKDQPGLLFRLAKTISQLDSISILLGLPPSVPLPWTPSILRIIKLKRRTAPPTYWL